MLDAIVRGILTGLTELGLIALMCMAIWHIVKALLPKPRRTWTAPPPSTGTPQPYDPHTDPQHCPRCNFSSEAKPGWRDGIDPRNDAP